MPASSFDAMLIGCNQPRSEVHTSYRSGDFGALVSDVQLYLTLQNLGLDLRWPDSKGVFPAANAPGSYIEERAAVVAFADASAAGLLNSYPKGAVVEWTRFLHIQHLRAHLARRVDALGVAALARPPAARANCESPPNSSGALEAAVMKIQKRKGRKHARKARRRQ